MSLEPDVDFGSYEFFAALPHPKEKTVVKQESTILRSGQHGVDFAVVDYQSEAYARQSSSQLDYVHVQYSKWSFSELRNVRGLKAPLWNVCSDTICFARRADLRIPISSPTSLSGCRIT